MNNNEALRRAFAPLGFSVSPAPNDAGLSMGGAYAAVRATRAHAQRTELLGFDVWDHADEAVHAWLRGGADGDAAAAADALLRGRPRPTGASTQRLAEVRSGLRDFARGLSGLCGSVRSSVATSGAGRAAERLLFCRGRFEFHRAVGANHLSA